MIRQSKHNIFIHIDLIHVCRIKKINVLLKKNVIHELNTSTNKYVKMVIDVSMLTQRIPDLETDCH